MKNFKSFNESNNQGNVKTYGGLKTMKNFKSFNESNNQGNVKTYGGLKAMINSIIKKQKLDSVKSGAVNILIDQACGLIPGLSNIKTGFDFFKSIYNADDTKKTNTWIDKLNIDDDFSKIVDNSIENQFIKNLYEMINKKPNDENLPDDFDINKELTEFLSKKYNNRTVSVVS